MLVAGYVWSEWRCSPETRGSQGSYQLQTRPHTGHDHVRLNMGVPVQPPQPGAGESVRLSYTNILLVMPVLLQSAKQQEPEQSFVLVFYGLSVPVREIQGQYDQCGVHGSQRWVKPGNHLYCPCPAHLKVSLHRLGRGVPGSLAPVER